MIKTSHSIEETKKIAEDFVAQVSKLKKDKALIIGLSGNLGSGKTTFTQSVARILEIKDYVTSPTFVIQKKYPIKQNDFPFSTLVHIDAYRLNAGTDMEALRFDHELSDPNNIIFVEWPEIIKDALPNDALFLKFLFVDETTRTIEFPDIMAV